VLHCFIKLGSITIGLKCLALGDTSADMRKVTLRRGRLAARAARGDATGSGTRFISSCGCCLKRCSSCGRLECLRRRGLRVSSDRSRSASSAYHSPSEKTESVLRVGKGRRLRDLGEGKEGLGREGEWRVWGKSRCMTSVTLKPGAKDRNRVWLLKASEIDVSSHSVSVLFLRSFLVDCGLRPSPRQTPSLKCLGDPLCRAGRRAGFCRDWSELTAVPEVLELSSILIVSPRLLSITAND